MLEHRQRGAQVGREAAQQRRGTRVAGVHPVLQRGEGVEEEVRLDLRGRQLRGEPLALGLLVQLAQPRLDLRDAVERQDPPARDADGHGRQRQRQQGLRGGALAVGHQQGHHQHHHGHGAIAGDVEQQARGRRHSSRATARMATVATKVPAMTSEKVKAGLLGRQVVPTITSALISK